MAADLFVVPTVTCRLLFVLVILAHDRRRIVHADVTAHSTASCIAQQLRNAFPEDQPPRYLVHDRDGAFADVATTVSGLHVNAVRTAPRSPWQNAHVERLIGSIRRECLDHVIVINEVGFAECSRRTSRTTRARVRISRSRKTARCLGPCNRLLPAGSRRRQKWAACTTATIASPRSRSRYERPFRELTSCLVDAITNHRTAASRLLVPSKQRSRCGGEHPSLR